MTVSMRSPPNDTPMPLAALTTPHGPDLCVHVCVRVRAVVHAVGRACGPRTRVRVCIHAWASPFSVLLSGEHKARADSLGDAEAYSHL